MLIGRISIVITNSYLFDIWYWKQMNYSYTNKNYENILMQIWMRPVQKKQSHQAKESTTSAIAVEESTTSPQTNWRSSNTCDITSSSITTIDSTNRRKLTHMWYHQWYHLISPVILSPVISKVPPKVSGNKMKVLVDEPMKRTIVEEQK